MATKTNKTLGTRAAETAAEILARLLRSPNSGSRAAKKTKQRLDRAKAQQAPKRYKFPPKKSKSPKPTVHVPVWVKSVRETMPDGPTKTMLNLRAEIAASLPRETALEVVLQELERGGYGGVALRDTGRSASSIAEAACFDTARTETLLRLLRNRGLAMYGPTEFSPGVRNWVPVRGLEESPYTFNVGDSDERVLPERIDFVGAAIEERKREKRRLELNRKNGIFLKRGRPRKDAA